MDEEQLIPGLRFSGYNDVWEQRELGDIGDTFTGLSGKTKDDFGKGEAEFVTYLNVFNNAISNTDVTEKVGLDNRQNEVKYGDIFFTTSSETPEEVGMSSVWLGNRENVYLNSFCFGYRLKIEMDPFYIAYSLRANPIREQFILLAQGISRYNISKTKAMDIKISLPKLEEQVRIGKFFKDLDKLITLHQNEYDKLLIMKKTMLEKMFPKNGSEVPEVRFSEFDGAWGYRKLGTISDKVTEKNVYMEYTETLTNSAEYGIISQRDFFDHDIAKQDKINGYYVVRPEDFVYNPRISTTAPVGPIGRNKLGRCGVISPLYTVFRPKEVDNSFLEQFFKSSHWYSFMRFNGDTGARSDRFSIKDTTFFEMPIPFPKLNEQRRIGQYLAGLDVLISLQDKKLTKLKNIKAGCLEKMFV